MSCNWSRGAVLVHQVSDSWIPVSGRHSQARLDPCYPLWEAQGTPSQRTGVCKPWHRDLCWSKESNLTGLSTPYLTQRCADVEISELGMELIEQSLKKSVYLDSICKSLQGFPSNQKALLFALFCVESNNINFYHHFANLQQIYVRQFLPLNTSAPVQLF